MPCRNSHGTASPAPGSSGAPSASRGAAGGTRTGASGHGRALPADRTGARRRTSRSCSARPSGRASAPPGGTACTEVRCRAPSDSPPLAGANPVVGLRGDVLHRGHLKAGGLQRADRGVAAGTGPLRVDLHALETVLHALAGGGVSGYLRRERGRLARALEAGRAGGLPADHVAVGVGDGHDRVVEARLDVCDSVGDVLLDAPARAAPSCPLWLRHPGPYFGCGGLRLPAMLMRLGPLRVRALVFVRWPWTGRPRRWRRPR